MLYMYPSSFTYTYTQINIRLFHYYLLKRLLFFTPPLCTFMKNQFPYKCGLVLFFFFQNCFVYSMSFYFHMNFVINLSTLQKYKKKNAEILIGIFLLLISNLIPLLREHGLYELNCLNLLRSVL